MIGKIRLPRPATVLAVIALFVALTGTATAVTVAAVPLAKRALTADNASKLQGKTAAALAQEAAQLPGPASSAAGLVTLKTQSAGQIAARSDRTVSISCDSGAKIMGAGFSSDGPVFNFNSYPTSDTTWTFDLANSDDSAAHNVSVYATCLK